MTDVRVCGTFVYQFSPLPFICPSSVIVLFAQLQTLILPTLVIRLIHLGTHNIIIKEDESD